MTQLPIPAPDEAVSAVAEPVAPPDATVPAATDAPAVAPTANDVPEPPQTRTARVSYVLKFSDAELLDELRRVAPLIEGQFTVKAFAAHGRMHPTTILNRFGHWPTALRKAGLAKRLTLQRRGSKYTWEDCFANMERLHRHYGRPPTPREAIRWPSRVGPLAYYHRFCSWGNMLAAFAAYRAGDKDAWPMTGAKPGPAQRIRQFRTAQRESLDELKVADVARRAAEEAAEGLPGPPTLSGLVRFRVLVRDGFRCVACGASPANTPGVTLHIDHKQPLALGGSNHIDNLRLLCAQCNVGRGTEPG